jgi:hypothetical protein
MSTRLRRALAVAAVSLAALAVVATAEARTPNAQLLREFQPVVVFDPLEQFRPTTIEPFVADAVLERLASLRGRP